MISLIICSIHSALSKSMTDNIRETICADYEIIHIDNSQHRYSIFEAYNLGVERARGQYLCFMHEDVMFRKQGWGKVIEQELLCDDVGALGVAGGHVVLNQLDWRFYGFGETFITQGNVSVEPSPIYYHLFYHKPKSTGLKRVAVVDGVWMCFRKTIFEHISFDNLNFHDFHLYDSDICMQVNKLGKDVCVTDEVFLEHQSQGIFSENYRDSLYVFFKKWESSLPLIKGIVLNPKDIERVLPGARRRFEERLRSDALVVSIRKKIQQCQRSISTGCFTKEEEKIMDLSSFAARKALIKDKSIPFVMAWKHTKEYLNYPFAHHKTKLLLKFFWYRIIKVRNRRA